MIDRVFSFEFLVEYRTFKRTFKRVSKSCQDIVKE